MADNKLTLAPNFSIPAVDYAGQGNAILGIRDAGKTYTAMKAAEELLDNKISIIVYDPVGVWKNLKIGTGKHKGYPIVVAGGEGSDIRLNVNNAVDIVRAAMKENVSLVVDLYSPELINKSSWIRIVQETVDLLMYENKECGLRHIFIEEAAEFIPQRLQPQHARVYSSLERLARMGRNARLGYTLINQRAEEVNKAILEISAFSLLHKQVGKNSLKSIQQWMELLQVENYKEIIQSLPALKQGECWVIGMNAKPHKIRISERKTFHPDPKKNIDAGKAMKLKLDVSSFVEKLNKQLAKPADKIQDKKAPVSVDTKKWELEINQLKEEIKTRDLEISELKRIMKIYEEKDCDMAEVLIQVSNHLTDSWKAPKNNIKVPAYNNPVREHTLAQSETKSPIPGTIVQKNGTKSQNSGTVTGGAMRMLKAAAMFHPKPISKTRMAALARLSYTSGSFGTYLSTLKTNELIIAEGSNYTITAEGLKMAGEVEPLPTDPLILVELWAGVIGNQSGAARMLRELAHRYPKSYTKAELGEIVGMSHTSGSFGTYLSTLKRNGLIKSEGGEVKASEELFN
jgi:hypothetical protein